MSLTLQFFNAGQKYGFNNMAATPALALANANLLGTPGTPTESWAGDVATVKVPFSGGFTATAVATVTSSTTAVLSSITYAKTGTNEVLYSVTGSVSFSLDNFGSIFQEAALFSGADVINGSSYDNILKGFGGNDRIDGGDGTDTAVFTGFKNQYQINHSGTAMTVSGPDGFDTLVNIERLRFDNVTIAFDTQGNAGKAYRLYQAAFDRTPDQGGLGTWIGLMDKGMSLQEVSSYFQRSDEFKSLYGTNVSNQQFVDLLYKNVLDRPADADGYATWKGVLDAGTWTREQVLIGFSESTENQLKVIGSIQNGIEYFPVA